MAAASRKVLFSHRLCAGGSWYFFDVRVAVNGTRSLAVSEARQVDGVWQRRRLTVFGEHLAAFREGLAAAAKYIESQPQQTGDFSVAEVRTRHPRAYAPWTAPEEERLLAMYRQGAPVAVMAAEFQRQPVAIRSRLSRLTVRRQPTSNEGASGSPLASLPEWKRQRPRAGRAWVPSEDAALLADFDAGLPIEVIAARRGRGIFSVQVRLCKLGRDPSHPVSKSAEPERRDS